MFLRYTFSLCLLQWGRNTSNKKKLFFIMPVTKEQLEKRAAAIRTGGKGTVRRTVKVHHKNVVVDKKVTNLVKNLNATPMNDIEEVTFFKTDGSGYVFKKPKVHTAMQLQGFVISGDYETKGAKDLLPQLMGDMQKALQRAGAGKA